MVDHIPVLVEGGAVAQVGEAAHVRRELRDLSVGVSGGAEHAGIRSPLGEAVGLVTDADGHVPDARRHLTLASQT